MATVKTAVSVEESLFKQVERLSRRLKIPRSQLFSRALEDFIRRYRGLELLEKLNQVYGREAEGEGKEYLSRVRSKHKRVVEGKW